MEHMDIDTRLKIEAEAKAKLSELLMDKGWPSNLIIEAVNDEIPYCAHLSTQWRGLKEHTDHAEAAAGNAVMRIIGSLSFEIAEKIRKKDELKNIIQNLPDPIKTRLLDRIGLIEQGKPIKSALENMKRNLKNDYKSIRHSGSPQRFEGG